MLKFTMDAKELKTMMEKTMTATNKKSALPQLKRVYVQVDNDGTVKVLGTDIEHHYVEIRSSHAHNTSVGVVGIDTEDIKVITKMNGEITLEDVSTEEQKINIACGKKIVSIPKYDNIDIFLPSMDDTETHILTMQESWLLETITNLYTYISDDDANKMMQIYHFNTVEKRVETLDGYRIGMRTLEKQEIKTEIENPFNGVKLHRMCMPVFKKIMDKKSSAKVKLYQDKKYIRIEGNDFTYITRRIDGEYFKINQMLTFDPHYTFNADRGNMLAVMKYNCDLIKQEKKSVILHCEDGKLYSYMRTSKYEIFDEIETDDNTMKNDLYIGFNPHFLVDAFDIIDCDNPVCMGVNSKSQMVIKGNEYKFLIFPINLSLNSENQKLFDKIKENIDRNRAA